MRRSVLTAAARVAAWTLACTGPASALTVAPTLNFATVNQSQWVEGRAFVLNESLGQYIDPTLSWDFRANELFNTSPTDLLLKALGVKIPFLDNGLKVTAGFGTSGTLGLDMGVRATTGHVNVNYPVAPTLRLPDGIESGMNFTLLSNWSLPAATPGCLTCFTVDQVAAIAGIGYRSFDKGDLPVDGAAHALIDPTPSLRSYFPALQAWADLDLQARGDVVVKVTGKVGAEIGGVDVSISKSWEQRVALPTLDKSSELLRVDSLGFIRVKTPSLDGLGLDDVFARTGTEWLKNGVSYQADAKKYLTYDYPSVNPWLRLEGNIPRVDTKGGVQADGRTLVAQGQDRLMTVTLDVPHLAAALLNAPLSVSVPGTPPSMKLDLVSGTTGPVADIYQRFSFDPTITVTLNSNVPLSRQLAGGAWTPFSAALTVPLGEPIVLRTPMNTLHPQPELVIRPVYHLSNSFTNETGVVLSIASNLDALIATFPGPAGDIGIGPILGVHGLLELGRLPIYKETFSLGGFSSITGANISLPMARSRVFEELLNGPWRSMLIGDTDPQTGLTLVRYLGAQDNADAPWRQLYGQLTRSSVLQVNAVDIMSTFFDVDEAFMCQLDSTGPWCDLATQLDMLCLDCFDLSAYLPEVSPFLLDTNDQVTFFADLSNPDPEPQFSYDQHPDFARGLSDIRGTVIPGQTFDPVITTLVPEPQGWTLVAAALLALAARRRRAHTSERSATSSAMVSFCCHPRGHRVQPPIPASPCRRE